MDRENGEQTWVHDREGTKMRDKEPRRCREAQSSSEGREGEITEMKMRSKYECCQTLADLHPAPPRT